MEAIAINGAAPAIDRSALLAEWMETYGESLLHLAYLYLNDRGAAEDVFQEAFLRAYRHMDGYRGEASVQTWLSHIAVNLCRDRLRSNYLRRVVLAGEEWLSNLASNAPDVPEAAFSAIDSSVLLAAVMQLSLPMREVVLLHYWQDLATADVATVLGLAEGTVRSRLHRARLRLKQMLVEEGAL